MGGFALPIFKLLRKRSDYIPNTILIPIMGAQCGRPTIGVAFSTSARTATLKPGPSSTDFYYHPDPNYRYPEFSRLESNPAKWATRLEHGLSRLTTGGVVGCIFMAFL